MGDAAFQARCLRRIQELRHRSATIVFISHDLGTVERLCTRAVMLDRGRMAAEGSARDVVTAYQRLVEAADSTAMTIERDTAPRSPRITGLSVGTLGGPTTPLSSGTPVTVDVDLQCDVPAPPAVVQAMVYGYDHGLLLFECATDPAGTVLPHGRSIVRFELPALSLLPGAYTLGASVTPVGEPRATDWWFGRTTVIVEQGPPLRGQCVVPYRWTVVAAPASASASAR